MPIIAEKDGIIKYVDLKQGISFRESTDDTTGISSKIVIDWSQNPKSKNFKPAINIVNSYEDEENIDGDIINYPMSIDSILSVEDDQEVSAGHVLARIPKESSKTKDITGGLPRVAELFEARKPKDPAIMCEIDGQISFEAREIKSRDELMLLNQAASMVDATYHQIYETMKPGVSEAQIVANANKLLYELGSDDVEAINAISGERCNPHPHNFTDRIFRPGDQAFFDILQSYMGYRTCYYRTFNIGRASDSQNDAYKQCREWLDKAIELVKPGVSTDKIASVWPKAEEFGFANEMSAFALQFGHGLGLAIHERPIISRLVSMDSPDEIKEGMVFALETYCPAKDGYSAARIEEELIVTDKGCQVISLFPAEDLPIANKY